MNATWTELRALEGKEVSLALTDGTQMNACSLVSAGRASVGTLWLFAGGDDTFIALDRVIAIHAMVTPMAPSLAAIAG